jgi:methyl-accepting chemotaxis protein/sigma-B regulation protein RsbU (phosphoserine phosphatase)
MLRVTKYITKTLSFRLSLMVLLALATLLMAALFIMFIYSRMAVKAEALSMAEQTLEATVQKIDNILLSIEQSSGNIYWKMASHINNPDKMDLYCRKLVEGNSYIAGCTIGFEPGFYKDRDQYVVAYRRSNEGGSSAVKKELSGDRPYYEQEWYTNTIKTGLPNWTDPQKEAVSTDESIISFYLPIYVREGKVGVMAVDMSLNLLSKIVLETKPSPNSFCILLGGDGSFIVHPDSNKLKIQTAFTQPGQDVDSSVREASEDMVAGKTGYKHVKLHGEDCYVFYKPFERTLVPGRSMEKLGWSVGMVYPENDIFGDYNRLLYLVLLIAAIGLLLLLLLCQTFIRRQFRPLRLLSQSAKRIADGHYDEPIPDTRQQDEVGRLQNHFQQMQQSLSNRMGEMERLSATLQERGEVLKTAYEQAQVAERMKINFLYNMTNQMISPVNGISSSVRTIHENYGDLTEDETSHLVSEIQRRGEKITALLNQLIADSEKSSWHSQAAKPSEKVIVSREK